MMTLAPLGMTSTEQPAFEAIASGQLTSWLAEQRLSLAFTTYQTGKLFLIGLQPDGRLSVFERTFNLCLGLWGDGQAGRLTSPRSMERVDSKSLVRDSSQTLLDMPSLALEM